MNDLANGPREAVGVEGAQTQGGLEDAVAVPIAACFPCCGKCRAARKEREDLREKLWHAEQELRILRDDARVTAGIVARQKARDEGRGDGTGRGADQVLAHLRRSLVARKDAAHDRMAAIFKGAKPEPGETSDGLADTAYACEYALQLMPACERLAAETAQAVRRGAMGFLAERLGSRFSGAADVLRMVEDAAEA